MAQEVSSAETDVYAVAATNSDSAAFYVIDRGSAGGFVVMSADDRLDPVLVIAPAGSFDPTPGTPLYDLLCGDVCARVEDAEASGSGRSAGWATLLDVNASSQDVGDGIDKSGVYDVRVDKIVQSTWNQSTHNNYTNGKKVYNYYTPNNWVCGCVATAGSQILRHWRYPTGSVTPVTHTCYLSGTARDYTMMGGVYSWDDMPLNPNYSGLTETQQQAIGKLCFDMGVAVYMNWGSGGSGAPQMCLVGAFTTIFGYRNAMGYIAESGSLSSTVIRNAMLANFDAGCPVGLSIRGPSAGHSIVADGYGYSGSTLYIHLNMGWGGSYDLWYNLPNIGTGHSFNTVDGIVYNIFPRDDGDLLTGRVVLTDGEPIAAATVRAYSGSSIAGTATTSATGIYALRLPGGKTYSVVASASGAETATKEVFLEKSVTLSTVGRGSYYPGTATVGNSWGNDFTLTMAEEPVAPEAPVGVSAWDGDSTEKIRIVWNASSGATYYKVYRASSDSAAAAECIAPSVTSLYYDDAAVETGETYYYWVKAGNSSGESGFSLSDSGWKAYAVPDAPANVSASKGTSAAGIVVSWNAVASATSYSVYRSESSSSSAASEIASGLTATTFTDTSVVVGTTYYYWVRAVNRGGTSGWSNSDSGYRKMAAPSAPTGVVAADGLSATEIVVSWNAVATAASYEVWRGTSSASSSASRIASGLAVTSYADASAVAGTTYYYWVKATNAGGTSGFSASDTGYLAQISGPATVTASDGVANQAYVRVVWQASSNATKYEVWRGTVNAYSQATLIASPAATSYNDTSATPGMRYWYWVRAVTPAGTSAFSASDSGYRPLAVPTGVAATTGREDGVKVTWAAVTGAVKYEVGRGDEGAAVPSSTLGEATSTSYTDATAVPGVKYAYFVRAVASACTGGWSAAATGSRSVPTPTNLAASDGTYTDRILVTWPALSGATGYELMRSDEDDIAYAETIATTSATSFSDTTAEYGLTYYYFLRAKFAAGTSPWSASEPGWRAFPSPKNVSATDGTNTGRITVSWDAIDGAILYQVWRYSSGAKRDELVGTSTTSSYNDSRNVVPGTKYKYCVKAVFPTGTSGYSSTDTGYLKASSPTPSASDGTSTSSVTLTWSAMPGAIGYLVYRTETSTAPGATDEPIASTDQLNYTDGSALKGKLYYYWVRTSTMIDTSDFGSSDAGYRGLPGASRVTASDGTYADRVEVKWNEVSGAASYEIWRSATSDSSSAARVARNVAASPWDDVDATPGVKCWYWVKACDVGPGLLGSSDSGWRKISAPSDIAATTNQTDGVKVSWKGNTTGVSFEIRRSLSDDFSKSEVIATVAEKSNFTDVTTVPGYRYWYWVRAYSELTDSAWSASAMGCRAVAAPATVAATDGTSLDAVTVTWAAATSAKRYEIWRNTTTRTDSAEQLGVTNKLVWVDATAEPGVLYYYWIKSVSALDTSEFSGRDAGFVSTPAPGGVTATDGAAPNFVRVSWNASSGAASYAVWRSESEDRAAASELRSGLTATEYSDASVTPGKFYWYWVRPVSAAGAGVFAGPDSGYASLSAPTELAATTNNETRVTVSWRRSNGASSYELFRAETDDLSVATNEVYATVASLSYGDTNTVPAVKFYYWVRSVSDADVSPLAGPADGFRLLTVPATVVASDGESDEHIRVSWSETRGAEAYEVWRAENSTSTSAAAQVASVTNALEYLDAAANAGVSYTYWVKATSALHTTAFSSYDKGWRSSPPPEGVDASDGTTSEAVFVSWSEVQGAVKYEVWRNTGEAATTNGASRVFTSADASVRSYSDTRASAGVKYWYWVRTVNATGTGVFSLPDSGFRAVAAPTNLAATDGTSYDYVRVSWRSVSGAESYEIRRTATNEMYMAATNFYGVTGTTFDDTNAVPGVVYSYCVRTISTLSASDFTEPDAGWRKLQKVNDVVAGDGSSLDAVELSWTVPEGAQRSHIWRGVSTSFSSASRIATVEGEAYSDESALHGVKYYYWVIGATDVEGEAGASNDGWRALVTPEAVAATDGDSTSHVRITWGVSPDATAYEIWRGLSADPASMTVLKSLASPQEMAWEDTSAIAGTNYWYAIRAGGTGGWSEFGVADPGFKALVPPGNVQATDGTQPGKVTVTWNRTTGAACYRVYRADSDAGAKEVRSGWLTGTSWTDTSVRAGVRYWYYVVAAVAASDDPQKSRPSAFSGGDSGYTNEDGADIGGIDLGGGISWPVVDNGDGTATTNAISFAAIEGGLLTFTGVSGAIGSTTAVHAVVKTSLDSDAVYTAPATLTVVGEGKAELDLRAVWGVRQALFVIGITTIPGETLP